MTKPIHTRRVSAFIRYGASLAAMMSVCAAGQAFAQAQPVEEDIETVVVTGFRGSLQTAINEKKRSNDMVDVIKAEDIGQFPDLNLAESLQRVPGISIDRDGGEGKQITVRGLNSEFSRTRLNGLEALSTTGSKDSSGGTNRGRGFDYNVFAADLFNSITVRKSLSAEVEEGSLGATIDLQTARPFDYKGFAFAAGGQLGYNDLQKGTSPRGSFMVSNRWADGKIGALLSVAYGERTIAEDATNTTRWENAYSNSNVGRFGSFSTDGGQNFTAIPICTNQGATSANRGRCNTTEVHAQNPTLTGEAQRLSRALHPRIPRYSHFETDQKRLGITGSLQVRPFADTLLTLDAMHATFEANRDEWEIEAISFSRARNGLPQTDVYNYEIDDEGTLIKGTFNDVDVRSEHRFDELKTEFNQLNFTWDQNWTDRFSSKLLIGSSKSQLKNPEQTTFTFESYDVDGYSYDYTNMMAPVFDYGTSSTGCTIDQACYWTYAATPPSGDPELQGDASLIRLRPQGVTNKFSTAKLDLKYDLTENFTLKGGASQKTYTFDSYEARRTIDGIAANENADGAIAGAINGDIAKYSQMVSVGGNTYLIPNLDVIRSTFDYNCNCTNEWGQFTVNRTNAGARGNNRYAKEVDKGWFIQLDFRGDVAGIPFSGNIGTREVETNLTATGYVGQGNNAVLTTVQRSYKDSLPSFNLRVEPLPNLYLRFAAAKTMARPTLLQLVPGGGNIDVTATPISITTGNPDLDPVRADTQDFSIEWYPDRDTLVSLAFFRKDIKTYIQQRRVDGLTLSALGYDAADFGISGDPVVRITTPVNTNGGELKGWEFSVQKPFTFLPGILSRTGGIFNYTNVESEIEYYTSATSDATTRANLLGLSPKAWNTTIYYEGPQISGRVAFAYRDSYLSALAPGSSADFWGKNETFNIDAQISYKVNNNLTFIFEGINLNNEPDDRFIAYNTAQGNTAQNLLYDYSKSGRQFYLGFRYKH